MQGSATYTTPTAPPLSWTYLLPMLLWGAVILFNALQFIALWRVGSILRRILFRMEHPPQTAMVHPASLHTEPTTDAGKNRVT
jgi:hypothetical protein